MTRPVEVSERFTQWDQMFEAIRAELTPEPMRVLLSELGSLEGAAQLGSYMSLARNVMANDRAAATVAAMLVATGIKPIPTDYTDVGEEA